MGNDNPSSCFLVPNKRAVLDSNHEGGCAGKHSPFSDCVACTHVCGHYLGVTWTCGPSPRVRHLVLRAGLQMCESWTCSAWPDTQWRDRGQEVSLGPAHVPLTETGMLASAVTLVLLLVLVLPYLLLPVLPPVDPPSTHSERRVF